MTAIDEATQHTLLQHLFAQGASTERQLEVALGDVDQISEADIAAWAEEASERGVIEAVAGSTAIRRWQITDDGRRAIGNNPDR